MAPVPKSFSPSKAVELFDDNPSKDSFQRPYLKKMHSCDLSVEVSPEGLEDDAPSISLKSNEEKKIYYQKRLKVKYLQEDKTLLGTHDEIYCETERLDQLKVQSLTEWLDQSKIRSPTEHDDSYGPCSPSPEIKTSAPHSSMSSIDGKKSSVEEFTVKVESSCSKPVEKQPSCQRNENIPTVESRTITKKKGRVLKRQSIGKKKRNKYEILCPDDPSALPIKVKRKRKFTKSKSKVLPKGRKHIPSHQSSICPSIHNCVDSGVSSGNSYNSVDSNDGGSDGGSGGNGYGGGNGSGCGGNGFPQKGGLGGNGGNDDDDKHPFSAVDIDMDVDQDETKDEEMSSKEASSMDCEEDKNVTHSVNWEKLNLNSQHLQHSAYCCNDKCDKPLCFEMKGEVQHFVKHKGDNNCCQRCAKILNLMKYHAACCKRPNCRVYQCNNMRKKKETSNLPAATPPQPVFNVYNQQPLYTDGLIVYNNTGHNLGQYFQENIDFVKGKKIGNGANGYVHRAHFSSTLPIYNIPMVVKETEYKISDEELMVYKNIGDHPNIVKHYMVVLTGDRRAYIFMEECDMSLKDRKARDTNEALFYWLQIVDAVKRLHDIGIIHKDIKRQNCLLSKLAGKGEEMRAKLADFDAARILEDEYTVGGLKPQGTRGFASPEVMKSLPHGRPADVHCLGKMLMELMGIVPKEGQLGQQIEELSKIDQSVAHLVNYCTQEDPLRRPTAADIQRFFRQQVPDDLGCS